MLRHFSPQQGWVYRLEGAENSGHHAGLHAHQGGGGGVYERGRCGESRIETSIKNKGYKVLQCSSQGIRLLYVLILVLERFSLNIDIFPGWKWKTWLRWVCEDDVAVLIIMFY